MEDKDNFSKIKRWEGKKKGDTISLFLTVYKEISNK